MLNWLCVKPSFSRARGHIAYAESVFRIVKYRPVFLDKGSADLVATGAWAAGFVHWYKVDHRHSSSRYVTSARRTRAAITSS